MNFQGSSGETEIMYLDSNLGTKGTNLNVINYPSSIQKNPIYV